jgi:hypothetical protein
VSACALENLAAAHRELVVVSKPFDEAERLREVRRLMPYESPQVKCARKSAALRKARTKPRKIGDAAYDWI